MADCMNFPKDWAKFLEDYSFCDHKEYYTNGARLIPTFRVEQMMYHYLRKAIEDIAPVVHGRWVQKEFWPGGGTWRCSECGYQFMFLKDTPTTKEMNYCPHCGAKMEVKVEHCDD